MIVLVEIEWHVMGSDSYPYYRSCDLCYQSAAEDACAGKNIEQFRQFFEEYENGSPGIIVCENCLEEYRKGD